MRLIQAGATSQIVRVFIEDSSQTDGRGLTGLAFNTGSLTAYYIRNGQATATAITLVTATVGTWTPSGFKEIDATNMPGWYELHLPNAAVSAGPSVSVMLKGAANMVQYREEIQLVAFNPQSANLGLWAQPVETGNPFQHMLAEIASACTSIISGGGTGTITGKSADVSGGAIQGTNTRVVWTTDANGNRSAASVTTTGLP